MKHIDLHKIASQFQIERDGVVYEYLKKEEMTRKLNLLNEHVDFNASLFLNYLVPQLIRINTIDFINKNHKELKGKLSISMIIDVSKMHNLVYAVYGKVESFKDLKNKYKTLT